MSYRDYTQAERGPTCPTCRSRQTSYCGETDDGSVWLCSPCCEAFFHEPAPLGGRVAKWLLWAALGGAALLILYHVAVTPAPAPPPLKGQPVPAPHGPRNVAW